MPDKNLTNAKRFYDEVLTKGKLELIDELVSDRFVEHEQLPGAPAGKEGVRAWAEQIRQGIPDLKAKVERTYQEGTTVVVHATMRGTHKGKLFGIEPTGKKVSFPTIDIIKMNRGKAVEHWGVTDNLQLMEQIGAAEAPPAPGISGQRSRQERARSASSRRRQRR